MIAFTVLGKPEPAGSKRAFALRKGGELTGRVAVTDDNPKAKGWKALVAEAAREAMGEQKLATGPVEVTLSFRMPRPQGHFGTGRNAATLKESAPGQHIVRPDSLKLARGTEDALTGIVWRDDSQVVMLFITKRYATDLFPVGCMVTVTKAP